MEIASLPRRWTAVAIAGLIAILLYWLLAYQPSEYRGAGPMRDTGFFSYYRYHAPLGEFPFHTEGTHEFRFGGLPNETMGLQFYASGYTGDNRAVLESLETVMSAEITDMSGNVICIATGSPAEWPRPTGWTLMSSSLEAAFWHRGCLGLPIARGTDYLLRVVVRAPDPNTPTIQLRAMLEGGGHELL